LLTSFRLLRIAFLVVSILAFFTSLTPSYAQTPDVQFKQIDPVQGFYIESDIVTTSIVITNPARQDLAYYISFNDVPPNRPDEDPSEMSSYSFINPTEANRTIDYTRRLMTAGDWKVIVTVRQADPPFRLVGNFSRPIHVKPAEFGLMQQQTKTESENLFLTRLNIIVSSLVALVAAVAGAAFTYYGGNRAERKKLEQERKNMKALVRHDLINFSSFLEKISQQASGNPPGFVENVGSSTFKRTMEMLSYTLHYQNMSFEIKARTFDPDELEKLEEVYTRLQSFRNSTLQQYEESKNTARVIKTAPYIYFSKTTVDELLEIVEDAGELLTM